jgi:hypothetical protein
MFNKCLSSSLSQNFLELLERLLDLVFTILKKSGFLFDETIQLYQFAYTIKFLGAGDGDPIDLHVLIALVVLSSDKVLQP